MQPLGVWVFAGKYALRCIVETPTQGRIVLNKRVLFDAKSELIFLVALPHWFCVSKLYPFFPHLPVQNIALACNA